MRSVVLLLLSVSLLVSSTRAADPVRKPIQVLVWDERQPEQSRAYTNFLGNAIADRLRASPDLAVKSVSLDSPEQGFAGGALESTDVIVWWGHRRQTEVRESTIQAITDRLKSGRVALIALHSAHWSQPFVAAMNERAKLDARELVPKGQENTVKFILVTPKPFTPPKRGDPLTPNLASLTGPGGETLWQLTLPNCCFPAYRADGKPSHVRTLMPLHPIAKGVPETWDISETEMYDEPFHVPKPDAVIFEEKWDAGERFRSGCLWQIGRGQVFYFRPGHETYPVYRQPLPLKVIENAVRWLGGEVQKVKNPA